MHRVTTVSIPCPGARSFAVALLVVCFASLLAATTVGQQLVSALDGLRVGERTIAFGEPTTLLAVVSSDEDLPTDRSDRAHRWLAVAAVGGESLASDADAWVRVEVSALGGLQLVEDGALWLEGSVQDAGDMRGTTRISFAVTGLAPATEEQQKLRATADPEPDLATSAGTAVVVTGRLVSINGSWWLHRRGHDVLLVDANGRRRTFPDEWAASRVRVSGRVERQLRLPVRDRPRDGSRLQMCDVIFGSEVALLAPRDDRQDRLVQYQPTLAPRRVDRVYDLIPMGAVLRADLGDGTAARAFAQRNRPWLMALLADDSATTREVLAARMADEGREHAMRLLYAGVLAAHDDTRGRDLLTASLQGLQPPDPDALYVLGAFAGWRDGQRCDESWAVPLALRCLAEAPRETALYSDFVALLLRNGAAQAVDPILGHLERGTFGGAEWPADPAARVRGALLQSATRLTDEQLLRLARSDPGDSSLRLGAVTVLLRRDAVEAVRDFLSELEHPSWLAAFRDHMGPRVRADIIRLRPRLEPELRARVEFLLQLRSPDAGHRLLAQLRDPATSLARLPMLCRWLTDSPDGERHLAVAGRIVAASLHAGLTAAGQPTGLDEWQFRDLLAFVARSRDRAVVAAMIDLLAADVADGAIEGCGAVAVRELVAGHLVEATGRSFGVDVAAWRTWFAQDPAGAPLDLSVLQPPALVALSGDKVETAEQWRTQRRPELLELFRRHVYGRVPEAASRVQLRIEDRVSGSACEGKAVLEQWRVRYGDGEHQRVDVLAFLPAAAVREGRRVPVFLGLNFQGNHTVHADPAIRIADGWVRNDAKRGLVDNRARPADRGVASSRWPVERVIEAGLGLVTAYYGDLDPDFDDGFANGAHGAFDDPVANGELRPVDAWGAIAAWAWGLSRILDTLEQHEHVDAEKVALLGHSRLGKTALWAGAQDERFALVISNESGCGGAAISRRRVGETVQKINQSFPHWFCRGFRAFDEREAELPVDQHLLIALIAPRPVYVASAVEDRWADPEGEFLSQVGAAPVYRLLGCDGFAATTMPPVDAAVPGVQAYHVRSGKHDLTEPDWQFYLQFAARHFE